MHRAPLAILVFLAFVVALPPGAAVPPVSAKAADPLWEKAVALAGKMESLAVTPGRMDVRMVMKKKDGTVTDTAEVAYRVLGAGDDTRTEVIKATENGKDVTEKVRAEERKEAEKEKAEKAAKAGKKRDDREEAKGKKDGATFTLDPAYHPFSPKSQGRITATRAGEAQIGSRRAVLFTFRDEAEEGRGGMEGKAWLDPGTGAPVQVEAKPLKLPKHADAMDLRISFSEGGEGLWYAEKCEVRGSGGLLWIQRRVESTFRFSEFRKGAGGA